MENYNEFEVNEQRFKVTYKYEKNLVWALTYVNGQEVKAHGDTDWIVNTFSDKFF